MNLASIIDAHPEERVALSVGDQSVSYGELRDRTATVRGALRSLGLNRGDRVAVIASNEIGFVACYLAVVGCGLAAVPLNPQYSLSELRAQLETVGAAAVVGSEVASTILAELAASPPAGLAHVLSMGATDTPGVQALTDLEAGPADIVEVEPDEPAVLMFTSGTAGAPKAAILTHGNLEVNVRQVLQHPGLAFDGDDVVLGVLPLYHIMGLNSALGVSLARGAELCLVRDFDPAAVVALVEHKKITVMSGPPTMWSALASVPNAGTDSFATVRIALSGAAPLPVAVCDAVRKRFGIRLVQGYGLTEASPAVTTAAGSDAPVSSIGIAMPGIELRIVNAAGADVLVGDEGELLVRGPNVFAGYWNEPAASARAVSPEGWLHTGDIAVVDDEGFIYLVDRAKDLIIVSGFNVYPAEVETVLNRHPDVASSAVVGTSDAQTGEAVEAYIVAVPGVELDTDVVRAWATEHLARYKWPKKITVVSELPRGLGGKLLRRALG